jgi:hypothetical protein
MINSLIIDSGILIQSNKYIDPKIYSFFDLLINLKYFKVKC